MRSTKPANIFYYHVNSPQSQVPSPRRQGALGGGGLFKKGGAMNIVGQPDPEMCHGCMENKAVVDGYCKSCSDTLDEMYAMAEETEERHG